jgi:hypothetical protein
MFDVTFVIPVIYWEADFESRLEHIVDVPPGKIVYHLSNTDYKKAKDVLCSAAPLP